MLWGYVGEVCRTPNACSTFLRCCQHSLHSNYLSVKICTSHTLDRNIVTKKRLLADFDLDVMYILYLEKKCQKKSTLNNANAAVLISAIDEEHCVSTRALCINPSSLKDMAGWVKTVARQTHACASCSTM